jgi:hypothetical protein
MSIPIGGLGAIGLWRGSSIGAILVGVAVLFVATAIVWPRALQPVERGWLALAHVLSIISTFVVLTLAFFLVVTPIGLAMRLFRRDLIGKRIDKKATSYWRAVETDGPCTRPMKPY